MECIQIVGIIREKKNIFRNMHELLYEITLNLSLNIFQCKPLTIANIKENEDEFML